MRRRLQIELGLAQEQPWLELFVDSERLIQMYRKTFYLVDKAQCKGQNCS